jgi:cobalt-zinc-cadmium efflux system outer membrane protein
MRNKFLAVLLVVIFLVRVQAQAQKSTSTDSLSITLNDAEKQFLSANYDLLVAKYQVNEADAAVIQARLWDNPTFTIDQGAYKKENNKWFDLSQNGQTAVSLQQLIHLAGQHNKRVALERLNVQLTTAEFSDLMRTLHYQLRTAFYSTFYLEKSLSVYDRELSALKTLVDAYAIEYGKGNVPFKEVARLQALQFALQNEKIELVKSLSENESTLSLLIGDTLARPIKPIYNSDPLDQVVATNFKYTDLIDSAINNRYDLKVAESQIQLEQASLTLQKSLRVPDMFIGANYDKNGSYIHNYNSVSLSFDLPIWNRNQGSIQIAKTRIDESKVLRQKAELQVKTDVSKAFTAAIESDQLFHSSLQKFDENYDKLFDGILSAYQNHSISLLEFIDYYETYKNSKTTFYQLQINRLSAFESLNEATGTIIIK